jgi:hypothetical protein
VTAIDPLPSLIRGGGGPVAIQPPAPKAASAPRRPDHQGDLPTGLETDLGPGDPGPTEMDATSQDLAAGLPKAVALLKVIRTRHAGKDCFQLEMHSYSEEKSRYELEVANSPDALTRQGRPDEMRVDSLCQGADPSGAVTFYKQMNNWSDSKYELAKWITKLHQECERSNDSFRLIVWDDTDFCIPWELYRHKIPQKPAQWLGVIAEVIRWTTVHDPERHGQFSAGESYGADGPVLLYEDTDLVENEQQSIYDQEWEHTYKRFDSFADLLMELERLVRLSLIYVRGHGTHGDTLEEATLAGVSLADASTLDFIALHEARPMVFLNACNSARAVIDKSIGDEVNRNFAEVFLRHYASGVVATMAEVDVNYSAALARELVLQARSANGVRIPEFLRTEREREAAGLPSNTLRLAGKDEEKILRFLRACMFAYFGHPDSVFRLAS